MRALLGTLVALAMLLGGGTTVTAAKHKVRAAARAAKVAYVCADCGVGTAQMGPCPVCKRPMGRVASYVCIKCQTSADFSGPCPTCHQPMQSVASQYRHCATCGSFYVKTKKACPVCAKKRKKK
jgi:recombinational DNA repair protein RecR